MDYRKFAHLIFRQPLHFLKFYADHRDQQNKDTNKFEISKKLFRKIFIFVETKRKAMINLFYETKCRRCGRLGEWPFTLAREKNDQERWEKLNLWVRERLVAPSVIPCLKCRKPTIQDYVSYTPMASVL